MLTRFAVNRFFNINVLLLRIPKQVNQQILKDIINQGINEIESSIVILWDGKNRLKRYYIFDNLENMS